MGDVGTEAASGGMEALAVLAGFAEGLIFFLETREEFVELVVVRAMHVVGKLFMMSGTYPIPQDRSKRTSWSIVCTMSSSS